MTRDAIECLTCGAPVRSPREQARHCDPAAFNTDDPDDAPYIRGED